MKGVVRMHHRSACRSTPRLVLLVVLVAAALCVVAGPAQGVAGAASGSPAPGASGSPTSSLTLRVGELQAPDNLNPFLGLQGIDYQIWHLNYDFLVGFDAKHLDPRPELATSWSVSPDGKTWTFHTRQGVTWQDGAPFTAADVAFTFNYIVKNKLGNLAVYADGITGAKAIDQNTVEVSTNAPKANMLAMVVPIIPKHVWSKVSGDDAGSSFQNPAPIVGTGPYQVVEFQKGRYVHLRANPDYWGTKPKVRDLYLMTYTNADTMVSDLKLGTIDAAVDVPPADLKSLGSDKDVTTNVGTSWMFIEIGMNCYKGAASTGNPVLRDPAFRQALQYAVDRQKFIQTALSGYGKEGSSLIVPYSKFHWTPPASQAYTYDAAKAKSLLAAAGYKDVNGDGYVENLQGKPFALKLEATNDSPANVSGGKLVVQWFKDVGVKVTFTTVDSSVLMAQQYNWTNNNTTYAPDFDMFMWYWTQDVDPQFMVDIYTPPQVGVWNDCGWTDQAYTKLAQQQSVTIDPAKRIPIVQQAQQIFYQQSPYIILAYPAQLEAWNSAKWTGWSRAPQDGGSAIYSYNNIDTYVNLAPVSGAKASGGAKGVWFVVGAVALVVIVALIVWLSRRGARHAVEQQ
jgi:peptide/nickel transport system substrate-binding protein